MIAGSEASGKWDDLSEQLEAYKTLIEGMKDNWEGASYNNLLEKSSEFLSEADSISSQITSFAGACDDYKKYMEAKELMEEYKEKYNHYIRLKNNLENNEENASKRREYDKQAERFDNLRYEQTKTMSTLKSQINTQLSEASSTTMEAASS